MLYLQAILFTLTSIFRILLNYYHIVNYSIDVIQIQLNVTVNYETEVLSMM